MSLNRLNRFFVFLLVFLAPSQLAYHFWPKESLIFGIRVDYLAPAVYLTDLIILFLLTITFIWQKSWFKSAYKKYRTVILGAGLFIFLNIIFSVSPMVALFRWFKVLEISGLSLYFFLNTKEIDRDFIFNTLFCSLVLFSLIGVTQFFIGHTIGGPFYFLGERTFGLSTPGIALAQINGKEFLRAYSTFSHPNSLSGYLGLSLIFLLISGFFNKKIFHILGFLIIISAIILTFSYSGILSLTIALSYILINRVHKIRSYINTQILFILIVFSLAQPVIGSWFLPYTKNLGSSAAERINLSIISGKMISQKFVIGEGLGNFIPAISYNNSFSDGQWLLQPVHNIFLLIFSETGVVGLTFLGFLFYRGTKAVYFPLILFILLTGSFDHYWITLQQNTVLLSILFGLAIPKANDKLLG